MTARPSKELKLNHDTGGAPEHTYIRVYTGGKCLVVPTSSENWKSDGLNFETLQLNAVQLT